MGAVEGFPTDACKHRTSSSRQLSIDRDGSVKGFSRRFASNRNIPFDCAVVVYDGENGRFNPIESTKFGFVFNVALPDLFGFENLPEILKGRFRHIGMSHDIVGSPKKFLGAEICKAAKFFVCILDITAWVRDGNKDVMIVENFFALRLGKAGGVFILTFFAQRCDSL